MDVRCSHILSFWLSFHLLAGGECAAATVRALVGEDAVLPCRYNVAYHGELHSCWGRGEVPTYGCSDEVIASDGAKVTRQASERYRQAGTLTQGDVSLTIVSVEENDAGLYGCRVHIKGLFNDQKETVELIVTQPQPADIAPESPTNETEPASETTWAPHAHTQGDDGPNSTEGAEVAVPQNSEDPEHAGVQLAVLLPAVLVLLLALVITFLILMRNRWKKAGEMLKISKQPYSGGIHYSNSDSDLALNSRDVATENIYQMDEGELY